MKRAGEPNHRPKVNNDPAAPVNPKLQLCSS